MNGKKAKRLRREAERRTPGKEPAAYERKTDGAICLTLKSTRGVYQNFKKWFKRGALSV